MSETKQQDTQALAKTETTDALTRRGITDPQWRTLCNNLFPGAHPSSVLMVIDYCLARKLDPMKKPCHIVPMKVRDAKTGQYDWRDVVMPGIYEYRTTAMRTGLYLGHSEAQYGPEIEAFGVKAPEWCAMTFYRRAGADRIEFPVRVYFRESCGTKFDKEKKQDCANDRWERAPIQMLTKVCEAAGLREAFPDEFGGETTAEEMDGGRADVAQDAKTTPPLHAGQRRAAATPPRPLVTPPANQVDTTTGEIIEADVELEPETQSEPHIGTIADIVSRGSAWVVVLSTGFMAATRSSDVRAAAERIQASGRRVDITSEPSKLDPKKYAPTIVELTPLREPGDDDE